MTTNFISEIEKARSNQYGSLHLVKKPRKSYPCRVCERIIPIGELSYTQHDYTKSEFMPINTRICENCAKELIKHGTKVKI